MYRPRHEQCTQFCAKDSAFKGCGGLTQGLKCVPKLCAVHCNFFEGHCFAGICTIRATSNERSIHYKGWHNFSMPECHCFAMGDLRFGVGLKSRRAWGWIGEPINIGLISKDELHAAARGKVLFAFDGATFNDIKTRAKEYSWRKL
jgi:hypothetical protein